MIKIGAPPKKNWGKIFGEVSFVYSELINLEGLGVRGKASVKKRVNAVGLDKVKEVIRFYDSWLNEDNWRNENFRFKGIDSFFAFKFDEIRQIMEMREKKKPKYAEIAKDGDSAYVDPFTR